MAVPGELSTVSMSYSPRKRGSGGEVMEFFNRIKINDHDTWLKQRQSLIQASDAASILGMSPWRTDAQLWDEKTNGISEALSYKPYIQYGKKMEEYIRESFLLDNPFFSCEYHEYDILTSTARPWQGCTLDGELTVTVPVNPWGLEVGAKGILECKTGSFRGLSDLHKWDDIPIHYYCQILHQLAVTGWDFVILTARLKRDAFKDEDKGFPQIEHRSFIVLRKDVGEDLELLNEAEEKFYQSLKEGKRPTFKLSTKEIK